MRGGRAPVCECRSVARDRRKTCAVLLVALGALLLSPMARATLAGDVAATAAAWRRSSRVEALKPRLLTRGDRMPLPLPTWSTLPGVEGCTTVAVLAGTSISFALQVAVAGADAQSSQVGWAAVTRCGPRRTELNHLWVEMRSPRAVVEVLAAQSASPLPSPGTVLPHRDPGPASELGEAGPAPGSPPLESRTRAWETRAKGEGARRVERHLVRAQGRRLPGVRLDLREGCHRFSALALQTAGGAAPPDLDLVLRGQPGGELVRGEQSENSDAELELCVGHEGPAELAIPGLPPGDPSVLQHAEFALPEGLPARWGPLARARFASAFFRRRQAGPVQAPTLEALGIGGRTVLPLELEARTCYAAAVAAIQGKLKSLLLDATMSDRDGGSDGTIDEPSLAIAFCTGDELSAQLRVEANGASLVWLAAVWRAGTVEPSEWQ